MMLPVERHNMSQPNWKLVANLGDRNPIDYGGYFVYEDTTGVYEPEAELLISPDSDESPEGWQAYRFSLDKCTFIDGILSDNKFHPEHPAWFAEPESEKETRPQDTIYLSNVCSYAGIEQEQLIEWLCGDDIPARAEAYRVIGEYHGFDNFDSYPLTFKTRAEVEARYNP
jgi:hypothetical protein